MKTFIFSTFLFIGINLLISWNSITEWSAFHIFRIIGPAILFGIIVSVIPIKRNEKK